jgi:dolichol-phosphate mannosyltransferase
MKSNACVILPTYNEAENIGSIIPRIFEKAEEIPTHDLHVLVVDDNSPDGTQDIVRTLMAAHENLHLITGPKQGLGEAYKRGMNYALQELSPDIVFEMDADGQHDPELIPVFAYLASHDISLVIGSRFAPGGVTPDFALWRRVLSLVGNWMLRVMGGLPGIHDCTSGYRCIKTDLLRKCDLGRLATRGYSFQSSLLSELLRNHAKVVEIPMVFHHRAHGESKLTLRDQVEFLVNVVKLRLHRSEEFIKFAFVGLSGVLVNLGGYLLLERKLGLHFALACPLAIELSILSNFLLNNAWTFRHRQTGFSVWKRLLRFHAVAGLAGVANYGAFLGLVSALHVYDVLANLAGILVGVLINYFLNSVWTWRESAQPSASAVCGLSARQVAGDEPEQWDGDNIPGSSPQQATDRTLVGAGLTRHRMN